MGINNMKSKQADKIDRIKKIIDQLSKMHKELLSTEQFSFDIAVTLKSKGYLLFITDTDIGRKVIPPIIKMLKDEIDLTSIEADNINIIEASNGKNNT